MKISVVTVCLNVEDTIYDTMKSVINQTYSDIEYIIIDGKSEDNTLPIIKSIIDDRIILISEKDNGIYNAMNKAIDICSGDYIIFMNSGDFFADEHVLEDVVPYMSGDIVYGNAMLKSDNFSKIETYRGGRFEVFRLLAEGRIMIHQSIFTRVSIMKEYKFCEDFKICADYDFVVRAFCDRKKVKYVDRLICIFDQGTGVSTQKEHFDEMRKEEDMSLKRNMPVLYWIIFIPKNLYRKMRTFLGYL